MEEFAQSIVKQLAPTVVPEGEMYVEYGAGGKLGLNQFPGGATEAVWIATFIMFILWLLALIICPLSAVVAGKEKNAVPRALRTFARASRDGFLILLGNAAISQSGYGVSAGVLVLTWIIFGLLCVWIALQIANTYISWAWWINSIVFLPIAVLAIINFALAFRSAPTNR